MAVIGRRRALLLLAGFTAAANLRADETAEVHEVVGAVAEALTGGEIVQAMSSFSKAYPDYEKLNDYFGALAEAYEISSQVDFTDEEISSATATVSLRWDLTLRTRQSGFTRNRSADLTLKLVPEKKQWRIVEFAPITLFDPQSS